MSYKLVLFDIDGTLIDRDTKEELLDVESLLNSLKEKGIKYAFVTNQGGPACRDAGWDFSADFPTFEEVEDYYTSLSEKYSAKLYVCYLYQTKAGKIFKPKALNEDDPRLNPEWRKPKPGMIIQAMQDFGIYNKEEAIFVGDGEEDRKAAELAGISYLHSDNINDIYNQRGIDANN